MANPNPLHVGTHLLHAAEAQEIETAVADVGDAFSRNTLWRAASWRLLDRRPSRLSHFGRQVIESVEAFQPRWVLATGIAPLSKSVLERLGEVGVERINYLTDDPWNPAVGGRWFRESLRQYDSIYTTRKANLADLHGLAGGRVRHLPFAYAPEMHFPVEAGSEDSSDVVFVGGADNDRVPWMRALIDEGLDVALFGGYWERYPETRSHARGFADPARLRRAVAGAKVSLCLVRRANRDGSSMRTFEVAAMGGCMLVEDTMEHRDLFGDEGDAVLYFADEREMLDKTKWLVVNPNEVARLRAAVRALIEAKPNTYGDRLTQMLAGSHSL